MDWSEAFFCQAKSEHAVLARLIQLEVEDSHQLHYVQMIAEKMAKGFLARPTSAPPKWSHAAFVKMLRVIKGRPEYRRRLGYKKTSVFVAFINSLLPFADKIEKLAPALGKGQPNPEYPWEESSSHDVTAPVCFAFPCAFGRAEKRWIFQGVAIFCRVCW